MGALFNRIKAAIAQERYVIGVHAALRLRQRRVEAWQVASGTLEGRLLRERPTDRPNPVAEIAIVLPDGVSAKAVWSWLAADDSAKLVTVHLDR